jgi:stress-induced morphogen
MSQPDLEAALKEGFPDAEIQVTDLAGDGDHYKARIVSAAFRGLPRVRQHQLVCAGLTRAARLPSSSPTSSAR